MRRQSSPGAAELSWACMVGAARDRAAPVINYSDLAGCLVGRNMVTATATAASAT